MATPVFIRLENTLESAMSYNYSPQIKQSYFGGVQLTPGNKYPYIQTTNSATGISIDEFSAVFVCDMCGNRLANIINDFSVIDDFNDENTGLNQIVWQILNTPADTGYQLVYLEILSGGNGVTYSSPFMLTYDRSEYSSMWHYRNTDNDYMHSVGLQVYFRNKKSAQTVTNYNPVSSGTLFTASTVLSKFERWATDVLNLDVLEAFKEIFLNRQRYSLFVNDLLPVYTSLYEAFETPDTEADENYIEQEILLARNYKKIYDPLAVIITPPAPDPLLPNINLIRVNRKSNIQVEYIFSFSNFEVQPDTFIFQYSADQQSWISSAGFPISPTRVGTSNMNLDANDYFYRIFHQPTGTYSNIVKITNPQIVITSAVANLPNIQAAYNFNYDISNLNDLSFQVSREDSIWLNTTLVSNNGSVANFTTPLMNPPATKIRIVDTVRGITSNTFLL